MAKDRPTGGFRFKKRVPIFKLPFGLGDVKVNFSMSHGIESVTAQGKLGKLVIGERVLTNVLDIGF